MIISRYQRPVCQQLDAYLSFIPQTLEKFPTLTVSRLRGMVREHGCHGGPDDFRHLVT